MTNRTPPDFAVPRGACDCHTHVFGPPAQFPFTPQRSYTPGEASLEELLALQRDLHLDRVVIVQPSVYGTDNSCTVDALRRLEGRGRAVAVIDDDIGDAELEALHRAGARGVRVNLATAGLDDPDVARRRLAATTARIAPLNWHVQIYTGMAVIAALQEELAALPVPLVIDHFGGASASAGPAPPGFAALLALVGAGKAYVKLSAPYRSSSQRPDYADVASLAAPLIAANPARMLWGSDWPHPGGGRKHGQSLEEIEPFFPEDDGLTLNLLAEWAPDPELRRQILVDNPARLYDFRPGGESSTSLLTTLSRLG
ncbi:MAG TPA: amidohydrolase family protein [Stellaceae bacterium]|jgi:predicted TIM-barrel fold metal-dependent hydrolase|nr:amidohydrolase family protein [Stellaceae bacterium]